MGATIPSPLPGSLAPRHLAALVQGIASFPERLLPEAPVRLEALLPHVLTALALQPLSSSAAAFLAGLSRCPSSLARTAALTACTERLVKRCHDLPARSLVVLCEDISTLATGDWTPSDDLLAKVIEQLDQKRYDLAPGELGRAAKALERAGVSAGSLRLEARDINRS